MAFSKNKPNYRKSGNSNFKKDRSTKKLFDRYKKDDFKADDSFEKDEDAVSEKRSDEKKYTKSEGSRFEKKSFNKKFDKDKNENKSENKSFDRSRVKDKYDSKNPKEKSDGKFDNKDKQRKKTFDRYRDDSRPSELAASKVSRSFVKPKFDKFHKKDKFKNREENKSPSAPRRSHPKSAEGLERLNKHIANAGICSRREADDLIASGVISVNGKVITEMGYKIKPTDIIKYGGQTLKKEKMVYVLLNKPKDYISTVDDPEKRKTVIELVKDACRERIYPVGRLDRATTGLLLLTNDGDLTKKLTHPKYGVKKVYYVELDKPLKKVDLDKIAEGVELEDGFMKVDEINYVGEGNSKKEIGVEIHSGKNRVVRRLFEHIGYNVRKLDRVVLGPLTKKDLPRGRWRHLTAAEVGMLNMVKAN